MTDDTTKTSEGEPVRQAQPDSAAQETPSQPADKASGPDADAPKEGVWKEDYDDVIEPPEDEASGSTSPAEKPKKKHWVGIITVIVIIAVLLVWTIMSPKLMSPQGTTYLESTRYASLGAYNGTRDIWTGSVVWGVSVSGPNNATSGKPIEFKVLVTKVRESTSNFFFRGLGISITNCSLWDVSGTYIAKMSSVQDLGFGKMATINTTLPLGNNSLYVSVKFTEYEVMRIGFIPLEQVLVEQVSLAPISVTA